MAALRNSRQEPFESSFLHDWSHDRVFALCVQLVVTTSSSVQTRVGVLAGLGSVMEITTVETCQMNRTVAVSLHAVTESCPHISHKLNAISPTATVRVRNWVTVKVSINDGVNFRVRFKN